MSHDALQWREMVEKSKGCFSFPNNADERVTKVIEIYGHDISVSNIKEFLEKARLSEEIDRTIRENAFEERSEVMDIVMFEEILDETSEEPRLTFERLHYMLNDDMAEFDFVGMRIASLATPLQEQLSGISTTKEMIEMAKDEVLWIFCAVYMAANYIAPAFNEV